MWQDVVRMSVGIENISDIMADVAQVLKLATLGSWLESDDAEETRPLSSEYGTYKTVTARFWPRLSRRRPDPQLLFRLLPLPSEQETPCFFEGLSPESPG